MQEAEISQPPYGNLTDLYKACRWPSEHVHVLLVCCSLTLKVTACDMHGGDAHLPTPTRARTCCWKCWRYIGQSRQPWLKRHVLRWATKTVQTVAVCLKRHSARRSSGLRVEKLGYSESFKSIWDAQTIGHTIREYCAKPWQLVLRGVGPPKPAPAKAALLLQWTSVGLPVRLASIMLCIRCYGPVVGYAVAR